MSATIISEFIQSPFMADLVDQKTAVDGEDWRITLSSTPVAESVHDYRGKRPWVTNSGN